MKIGFKVKYGYNEIEIPVPERSFPKFNDGATNLFNKTVTIYNDVSPDGVNPRRFYRYVLKGCAIYNQLGETADGTISRVVNAQNVIIKDVEHYKSPIEYSKLPADIKGKYYTAKVNDFVVLAEVDDVVTTAKEFQALQEKYADIGFSITAVNASINGMAVDNVHLMHA